MTLAASQISWRLCWFTIIHLSPWFAGWAIHLSRQRIIRLRRNFGRGQSWEPKSEEEKTSDEYNSSDQARYFLRFAIPKLQLILD
jgi:hypothetical protein